MGKTSLVALVAWGLVAGCTPVWQGSLGSAKVRPLAEAELGCPAAQLDVRAVAPSDTYSPLAVKGCGKDATYLFAMGAGYVLSSVRNGGDVAVRTLQLQE